MLVQIEHVWRLLNQPKVPIRLKRLELSAAQEARVLWVTLSLRKQQKMEVTMDANAQQIIDTLGLKPHPTCGFVIETYRSQSQIPQTALPGYEGSRPFGSVLYFMVTPQAQIRLHRIRSDQMYHHYLGDPLEVLLLYPDGTSAVKVVGSDLAAGMRPQLFIPGHTFHVSRLPAGSSFALLGTSEWPGVEPPDVEIGDPERLMAAYPAVADQIRAFTNHGAS
jgi:predicted cupin superfamily sugar epimerase